MHRVRAYTFDFCCFLYVAYTTLNKLFAVYIYIYYICGFTKEFIALCSLFGRTCMFQDLTHSRHDPDKRFRKVVVVMVT